MWWRLGFGLSLLAIVAVGGLAIVVDIGSISASDSCNGCDASPAWTGVAEWVALVAFVVWLGAALTVSIRRRRGGRSGSSNPI